MLFDYILQGNAEASFVAMVFLSSRNMQQIFNMIVKEMTVLLLLWYGEFTYRYSNVTMTDFQHELFTLELYPRFNTSIEAALFNGDNLDKYKKVQMESFSNLLLRQTPLHEKEARGRRGMLSERGREWREMERPQSFKLHLSFLLVPADTFVHWGTDLRSRR